MKTVLLVDADIEFRSLVTAKLRASQLEVVEAGTMAAAETASASTAIDLVVMDDQSLDGSGTVFMEKLRASNRTIPMILIFAVSNDWQTLERMTKELDVCQIFHKPMKIEDFVNQVRQLLDEPKEPVAASPASTLAAELEALQAGFTAKLPQKLDELEAAIVFAKIDREGIAAARGLAHRLRGSAGSYGHAELGETVGSVEDLLAKAQADPSSIRPFLWEEVDNLLRDTRLFLERNLQTHGLDSVASKPPQKAILVVDDSPDFLRFVRTVGRKLVLPVVTAQSVSEALQQARSAPLLGVVLDVHLFNQSTFALARDIRDTDENGEIPIAFASVDNSIETRVAAIQAGGMRFFEKPMSMENFAEVAQQFSRQSEATGGKALIVDDDPDILEHYSILLRAAGIGVTTLESADGITDKLDHISADVLLLDVNLPGISGLDVCRALKLSENYEEIPILIITAQTDDRTRLLAFRAGACDVVTKPVIPEELIARVAVQLERVRFQRDRADVDSLSGLLNRRALIAATQRALSTAMRIGTPLSMVLIDIDRFKVVNDTYGHLAGDQVIAALGNLLRRRFRVEDIRNRWGGEEFMLVFWGSDATFAEPAAAAILSEFSNLRFTSEEGATFSATFTAGVATYPEDGASVNALVRSADERLYAGKEQGRNRVVGLSNDAPRPIAADIQAADIKEARA